MTARCALMLYAAEICSARLMDLVGPVAEYLPTEDELREARSSRVEPLSPEALAHATEFVADLYEALGAEAPQKLSEVAREASRNLRAFALRLRKEEPHET